MMPRARFMVQVWGLALCLVSGCGQGNSAVRYFHYDRTASVVAVTRNGAAVDQRSYRSFGTERGRQGEVATEYGFTGKADDPATGISDSGARYYAPSRGIFISPDPLVRDDPGRAVLSEPWSTEYTYAANRPTVAFDPDGRAAHAYPTFPMNEGRARSDAERSVIHLSDHQRDLARLTLKDGVFYTSSGEVYQSAKGKEDAVMDKSGAFYAKTPELLADLPELTSSGEKVHFQHSSYFGGEEVAWAGQLFVGGTGTAGPQEAKLGDESGHYMQGAKGAPTMMSSAIDSLQRGGIEPSTVTSMHHNANISNHDVGFFTSKNGQTAGQRYGESVAKAAGKGCQACQRAAAGE